MQAWQGTRQQILQLLQGRQGLAIGELAHHLGLSPATVRRHMDILQRDHLVAYHPTRKPTGRPEHTYFLTEDGQEVLPKTYAKLLASLIKEIGTLDIRDVKDNGGHQLLEKVFQRLAQQTARQVLQHDHAGVEERLGWLIQVLEQHGFRPQVKKKENDVSIRLFNCPYRIVAMADEAVCTFDKELIASLLLGHVTKQECIRDGDTTCCYKATLVTV